MESEKIKTDIDGYNTRPLLSGRVFCTCGNEEWREKAGMASGFVPAEMGDGVEMHVRRLAMQAEQPGREASAGSAGKKSATKKYPHDGMGTFVFTI